MAAFVLTQATVLAGAAFTGTAPGLPGTQTPAGTITTPSDLSTYCTSVAINLGTASQDTTNFGSGGFINVLAGLKSATITLNFNQDFAASQIHSIITTTLGGLGSVAYLDIKSTSAVRSATNPSYVFAVILTDYNPVMGAVGDKAAFSITWPSTGAFLALTS